MPVEQILEATILENPSVHFAYVIIKKMGEQQKSPEVSRFMDWLHHHKIAVVIAGSLALLMGTALAVWALFYQPPVAQKLNARSNTAATRKVPVKFYSPLTGLQVADEAATKRQVTAIMLENSPDSRPQSGIRDAGIVYEAIAEGGITRFQCLYQEARPGLIGPVRSLRPYYLEWAAPYDPAFAHIGGSKRALDTVRSGQFKDIDQFFNAGAYYRSTDRYAPHNVYTTFDRLDALNDKKGFKNSSFEGFARAKKEFPAVSPNAGTIEVSISGPLYNSSYSYDKTANHYVRSQAGKPHTDREHGGITPKVVIVMKVHMSLGFEDGYREQIETNGQGDAYVFQNGTVTEATWKKDGIKGQLSFTDKSGKIIALNRGQTWITAIPKEQSVNWK